MRFKPMGPTEVGAGTEPGPLLSDSSKQRVDKGYRV